MAHIQTTPRALLYGRTLFLVMFSSLAVMITSFMSRRYLLGTLELLVTINGLCTVRIDLKSHYDIQVIQCVALGSGILFIWSLEQMILLLRAHWSELTKLPIAASISVFGGTVLYFLACILAIKLYDELRLNYRTGVASRIQAVYGGFKRRITRQQQDPVPAANAKQEDDVEKQAVYVSQNENDERAALKLNSKHSERDDVEQKTEGNGETTRDVEQRHRSIGTPKTCVYDNVEAGSDEEMRVLNEECKDVLKMKSIEVLTEQQSNAL